MLPQHLRARLDERPLLLAVAGPNGAGKSTFIAAFLGQVGLRLVNADLLAKELGLTSRDAAALADALRETLVDQGESFITETVFPDPVGAKLAFFAKAQAQGYQVVLLFIGISGPERSDERVAMRVSQGGHDVPADRLPRRYRQSLLNLAQAAASIGLLVVFDNDDLAHPYRCVGVWDNGRRALGRPDEDPAWLPELPA